MNNLYLDLSVFRLSILGAFVLLCMSLSYAQSTSAVKNQILILGSYHMSNPGQDVNNLEADNVLAPKRQKEIKDLVAMLAKFKPTKVAIEVRWQTQYDTIVQEEYQNYLKGSYTLDKGEDQQIGYRLAKQLKHNRIYCIDAPGRFDYNTLVQYAQENEQGDFFAKTNAKMATFMKEEQTFLTTHTVSEVLKRYNEPQMLKEGHSFYVSILQIGKNKDYPGADLVSDWYERNFRIFSNITRIVDSPKDRILVIIGAGHAPILRELVKDYPTYELVELGEYLK